MDSEGKLYAVIWLVIAAVISVITISIATVSITDSNNITRLVLNGATPVDAYCAVESDTTTARCLVSAIGAKRD